MPFTSWRTFTVMQRTGSSRIETQAGAEKDGNDHICSCAAAGAEADFPSQFARLNHVWPLLHLLQMGLRIFDVARTGAHASRQPCIAAAAAAAAAAAVWEGGRAGWGSVTRGDTRCTPSTLRRNTQAEKGSIVQTLKGASGRPRFTFILKPYWVTFFSSGLSPRVPPSS